MFCSSGESTQLPMSGHEELMGQPNGFLEFDEALLAKGFDLPVDDVFSYFTDGRRISFILERRLARNVMHGTMAESEGSNYDLIDQAGQKWEVRSLTRRGGYFTPSEMVGKGRVFREDGFLAKLNNIHGFIVSDIDKFPRIPYWLVSSKTVRTWYENGEIGANAKVTQSKGRSLLYNAPFMNA